MIYVLGGEKGGTGKSCFAQNLAVCLQKRGRDVMLLDGDPQRTSVKWATKRAQKWPAVAIPYAEHLGELYTPLQIFKARHQDVVVDVAGADSEELRTALLAADVLYTPVAPGESDLETVEDVEAAVKLIKLSVNPKLRAYVALNLCDPKYYGQDILEAMDMLKPVLDRDVIAFTPITVCMRKPLRRAHAARLGVVEFADHPDRAVRQRSAKAIAEIWEFYRYATGDFDAGDTTGTIDANGTSEVTDT